MSTLRLSLLPIAVWLLIPTPAAPQSPSGVRVDAPGPPQLTFACCDKTIAEAQQLLSDPAILTALTRLHAGLVFAVPDFSRERAQLVQRLNAAGIPLVAWIELSPGKGSYFNAGSFPDAQAAVNQFEQWTAENSLRWQGVGLDIEPNFSEFAQLRGHRWQLVRLLASRYFDRARVFRARSNYAALIRQLHDRGYFVQTYQLPFIVAEREEHSTVLERLLGIVDVRGDQEALMLYTSYAPNVGAGMIWTLGPHAQAIGVGSTEGAPGAGSLGAPLSWTQFSQALIVAAHFSHTVGIYSLEGCVQQGYLDRIESLDWGQSTLISSQQLRHADRMSRAVRAGIWIATTFPLLLALVILWLAALIWYRRVRRRLVRLRLESPE